MPRARRKRSVPDFEYSATVRGDLRSDDPDTLLRTYRKLQRAVAQILNKATNGPVLLDLADCRDIDTGGLLLTMYAFDQIWRVDNLSLWYKSLGAVHAYILENLEHFWEASPQSGAGPADEFLLRQIENREDMVKDLSQYANSLRKASYSSAREVAIWETQVGELATNGFQHGTALDDDPQPSIPSMNMIAGKAYGDRNRVEMGVLDFGASIPRVIERVLTEDLQLGDGRLIAHALKRGVTSKTVPENQGAGLHGVVEAVKDNGGSLLLLSGNGLACVRNGRIGSRNLKPFGEQPTLQGTLVIIILNLHRRGEFT